MWFYRFIIFHNKIINAGNYVIKVKVGHVEYDKKASYEVTKKDVKDDYDFDNVYRQYKTTMIYIDTTATDETGNVTNLSDKDKYNLYASS